MSLNYSFNPTEGSFALERNHSGSSQSDFSGLEPTQEVRSLSTQSLTSFPAL